MGVGELINSIFLFFVGFIVLDFIGGYYAYIGFVFFLVVTETIKNMRVYGIGWL